MSTATSAYAQFVGQIPRFKPRVLYLKLSDWLMYWARDCSYVATPTTHPQIELLVCDKEVVGVKILSFSLLPRSVRDRLLEATRLDLDAITGIEELWKLNLKEMSPELSASEMIFFQELRRVGTAFV